MSLIDFASALEDSSPNSILFIAVLKPKIYFVPEIVTERARETDLKNSKYLESKLSKTKVEFLKNLDLLSIEKIRKIKVCSRSQC